MLGGHLGHPQSHHLKCSKTGTDPKTRHSFALFAKPEVSEGISSSEITYSCKSPAGLEQSSVSAFLGGRFDRHLASSERPNIRSDGHGPRAVIATHRTLHMLEAY